MNKIIPLGFFSIMIISPMVHADPAGQCLHLYQKNNNQYLKNICNVEVEAAWCVSGKGSHYECDKLDNQWTIRPGAERPIGLGYVRYNACAGANSILKNEGKTTYCK